MVRGRLGTRGDSGGGYQQKSFDYSLFAVDSVYQRLFLCQIGQRHREYRAMISCMFVYIVSVCVAFTGGRPVASPEVCIKIYISWKIHLRSESAYLYLTFVSETGGILV